MKSPAWKGHIAAAHNWQRTVDSTSTALTIFRSFNSCGKKQDAAQKEFQTKENQSYSGNGQ